MIIVSACFAGFDVKYNGSNNVNVKIKELFDKGMAIPVCPEVLGGLSIPREPAEIVGGDGDDVLDGSAKVLTTTGRDVTEQFLKGAYETLKRVKEAGVTMVVLKERSPSCGSTMIYSGKFNGSKRPGNGVTSALLKRSGIQVVSEDHFIEYLERMDI
ncbi:DUF523 domain-containing protein [Bacillus tuaregi]|uniref:DUF523 domain-containing protein n=1 Tax=Bacillus tuaregi TaxID=1816695 RepID=UPI0008F8BBCB|nr:DUF523 domain-containing protein [Bacillus tuaregi]